jgi:multicomponent Na+:H+ antiporter subunit G
MTALASILLLTGAFFALVAALGVFRFGDFYARIHAATKASTFGIGFSGVAAALALGTTSAWIKMAATITFLFMTLPIAAHLLARAVKKQQESPAARSER